VIKNIALIGPEPETRRKLGELVSGTTAAVYRVGRLGDPLPVTASFDALGARDVLDWFEKVVLDTAPQKDAVLLIDDWALCHRQDPGLDQVVRWVAALGPRRGVQVVVTARAPQEIPAHVRKLLS
jgi:hypothetical protein